MDQSHWMITRLKVLLLMARNAYIFHLLLHHQVLTITHLLTHSPNHLLTHSPNHQSRNLCLDQLLLKIKIYMLKCLMMQVLYTLLLYYVLTYSLTHLPVDYSSKRVVRWHQYPYSLPKRVDRVSNHHGKVPGTHSLTHLLTHSPNHLLTQRRSWMITTKDITSLNR